MTFLPLDRLGTRFRISLLPISCFLGGIIVESRASPIVEMTHDAIRLKAEAGDPYYQAALALVYLHGDKGQSKSTDQFKDWASRASIHHPLGLFAMGYAGEIEGDKDKAKRYYRRAFGPEEGKLIKMAAEGDALASFCLAEILLHEFLSQGHSKDEPLPPNLSKDLSLVVQHYRIAGERGYMPALVEYAFCRLNAWGVEKNEGEGVALLMKAANEGLPMAHFYLARAFYKGLGVQKNHRKALDHMLLAAERNLGVAHKTCAQFFAHGVGHPDRLPNWQKASEHAGRAEALGVPGAADLFQQYDRKRQEAETSFPEPEITQPSDQLDPPDRAPQPPAIDSSPPITTSPQAEESLRQARDALFRKHEVETALAHLQAAISAGSLEARRELAQLYYDGKFVDRDLHLALKWFLQAAEAGDATSQRYLGVMYFIGKGVAKDKLEGVKWMRRAAAQGDELAKQQLPVFERAIKR